MHSKVSYMSIYCQRTCILSLNKVKYKYKNTTPGIVEPMPHVSWDVTKVMITSARLNGAENGTSAVHSIIQKGDFFCLHVHGSLGQLQTGQF